MSATTAGDTSRFRFPTAFTILFGLIVVVAILTWIIPAGRYDTAYSEALDRDVHRRAVQREHQSHRQRVDAWQFPRGARDRVVDERPEVQLVAVAVGRSRGHT